MAPKVTTLRHAILQSLALGLFAAAGAAIAQDPPTAAQSESAQPTELDRIEVTGSRILRTETETASPVQTIRREQIDRTGKKTIGEFLQTLAVDGSGSVPKSFGAGFASGAAGVSLRGLGAGNTLVLVNGRRIAPYGMADDGQKVFTDLSIIPLEAVERVEVLKDGASAIYGSDAIAGVVNIILRNSFEGATATASYGASAEGDGNERKGSFTWGAGNLNENGVNFFFSVEAGKSDEVFVRDRKDRKWIGTGDISPWGYNTHNFGGLSGFIIPPDGDNNGAAGSSPVGSVELGRQGSPGVKSWGSLGSAADCAALSNANQADSGGGCVWDSAQFTSLQPAQDYLNFFSRGTFALSDDAELYTELAYGKKNSAFHNTPSGVSSAWGSPQAGAVNASSGPGATVIGANHPDHPGGAVAGQDLRLRYSAFDVGPRRTVTDNQFFRFVAGVKGLAGEWDYDVSYLHSGTQLAQQRTGYLHYGRVREVLTAGDTSPVGWWRLGTNAGLNSQALYNYISPTIGTTAQTTMDSLSANFSRSLAELRGGPLGLAVGGEWRRLRAGLKPVTFTDEGNIIGLGYSAYDGEETVTSAYAELVAPVLESLELSGALRMDSYREGQSSVTPKFGAKWTPAEWIAVRGTYAEGFRSPNAAETAGSSVGFASVTDTTRCIDPATGVPRNPRPVNCPVNVAFVNRPNADLEPEKSKSYSVGIVLQPTASTTVTLDAWKIERVDEITTQGYNEAVAAGNVIRADDDIPGVPNSGTPLAAYTDYINANSTTVEGVDLDARQTFDLGDAGSLALDLQLSRIERYALNINGQVIEIEGTHDNCSVTNCIGTPKDRVNFGATWDIGAFTINGIANYRSRFENTVPYSSGSGCGAQFANNEDAPANCEMPSFTSIDLSANWRATEAFELFGSVQNVADRIAPLDVVTYGALNYNPLDFSGAMGRFYTLGVKYNFQ